ncbi:MAG: hypothetical protein D6732_24925 [Methanobacteriota archaeon]|nr:MAG: hypothetical protein D6732_24925 [Euryarchaeota archaeon]
MGGRSIDFKDINFGYASAERESLKYPHLLTKGFLDGFQIREQLLKGDKFIILGYKGTGKSAIGEHFRLVAQDEPNFFAKMVYLEDFPYAKFRKVIKGSKDETRFSTAWGWLLLLLLLDLLWQDEEVRQMEFAQQAVSILKASGLWPVPHIRQLVVASARNRFALKVPLDLREVFPFIAEEGEMGIESFVEHFQASLEPLRHVRAQFIVGIDGLDDVLLRQKVQYEVLGGLLFQVNRLNMFMQRRGIPVKYLFFCRTELYERLPVPNKNKIRQDSAVVIDWYKDLHEPRHSLLVRIANIRAKLSDPTIEDLFDEYFPEQIQESKYREKNTLRFLLDLTRHNPRDFLQLLIHIQHFSGSGKLTQRQIQSGIKDYSIQYFLPEIRDELAGYADIEEIESLIKLLGALRKRDFSYGELEAISRQKGIDLELPPILEMMFDAGAIGNVRKLQSGARILTFRFRNRNSTLNLDERLILHKGLWKALNLV